MPRTRKKKREFRKGETKPDPKRSQAFPVLDCHITISPTTTTFRTLPRELRQNVLFRTFDANQHLPVLSKHARRARLDEMESWAAVLRAVDAQFIDDVDFVAIEWGKTLSTTFAEQDKLFSKKCEELRKKVEDAQGETFPSKLLAFVDKLNEEIGGLRLLFEVEKTYASVLRK